MLNNSIEFQGVVTKLLYIIKPIHNKMKFVYFGPAEKV